MIRRPSKTARLERTAAEMRYRYLMPQIERASAVLRRQKAKEVNEAYEQYEALRIAAELNKPITGDLGFVYAEAIRQPVRGARRPSLSQQEGDWD